jgi:hypothetical protein
MDSADWHARPPGTREWRYDQSGIYLRNDPNVPLRTHGQPTTCMAIVEAYGPEIYNASRAFNIPPELIIMTIATEAGSFVASKFTGPPTFRWEAKITDYSAGPMQLLCSTARDVISKVPIECDADDIPQPFAVKPVPPPPDNPLYDAELNINVGTAYIARNARQHNTGLDPILVAACYNAGSLRPSTENPWGLVTFGDHLGHAAPFFGDACAVMAELRASGQGPAPQRVDSAAAVSTDNTYDEKSDLTRDQAEKLRIFYEDADAEVEWSDQTDGRVTLVATFKGPIQQPAAPTSVPVPPPGRDGYVLCINRVRTEQRASKPFARTVGFYQAFFNNEPIPEISGVTVERQGPGDNSNTGVTQHRRLEAGSYPLLTHAGANGHYRTLGYPDPGNIRTRPWPCVRVGNTGSRSGILCHCAGGYLMSIGCINLTGVLPDAKADIDFGDSRRRVMALINSMNKHLGPDFPTMNNATIKNAMLLIRNEP